MDTQAISSQIPEFIKTIYHQLQTSGFQVYFVGGCVRDLFLNRPIKDWDLTTNATPGEIQKLFPDSFYDNDFGTVGVSVENEKKKVILEITTFRTEHGYSDRRHPESVSWGKTIEEDLSRRDFTINAMAVSVISSEMGDPLLGPEVHGISHSVQDDRVTLIDPYNGQSDLQNKLIRAVGNPQERFKEDALRLMRAIRFATQLGFAIEEETLNAINEDAPLLAEISHERIRDEFLKILDSEYPYEGVMLLKNTNLLSYILPELLEGIGISQTRPGRHHTEDVFTHNVLSLKYCPSNDPIVRFATLIHDIGKPRVQSADDAGLVIFHNHEVMGARMAAEICDRLRLSKKQKEKVVKLIRWHMFTVDEHITDSAVRRFIRRIGVDNVKDMMDLRVGDRLGGGTQTAESWRLKLFKKRVEEQLAPAPFSITNLAVDGNDIMKELQIKPSKQVGIILQKLFEEVDEDLSKNTRDYLIPKIHDYAQTLNEK